MLVVSRRNQQKKLPSASIRVMGDKVLVEKLVSIIIRTLEDNALDFTAPRVYPMYKDKKKRKEIDHTRSRVYINVYGSDMILEEQAE